MSKGGKLKRWAQKGIVKTLDVWDFEAKNWRTKRDLNGVLKTPKIESQRLEITGSIPWDLGAYPEPCRVGEWLLDTSALPPPRVFHIQSIREGKPWGWSYFTRPDSDLVHKLEEEIRLITTVDWTWARVATRSSPKDRVTNFNPKENPPDGSGVWIVGKQGICNLQWDPKEWRWGKLPGFPEANFL